MKYALLVYDKPGALEALPESERDAVYGEFMALTRDPRFRAGEQLQPAQTAQSVQVTGGAASTSPGPAVSSEIELSGYYVFEAADGDEAAQIAARVPSGRLGGRVEVRPLVER
jgi:hypothetical protein